MILVFGGLSRSETHLAVVETPRVKDKFCLMICPSLKLLGKSPETHGATRDFSLRFSLIFDKIYILYQHVPTCANSCWKGNAPGQERDRVFSQMIGVPAPWQECPGRPFCPDQRLKDEEIHGCYQWVLDLLDLLKMICYFPIGESTRHGESNLIRGFSIFDGPQKRHNSRSAPHGRADLGLSSPSSHQRRQNLRRLKMFSAPHLNS